ncbi:RNA polymerase sigma factor [Streptomyces coffeae]|uniref:Sigma-70 family RNA polymerase sigma factor n=1 Tax=Streptomyces coffeae TaxID=621382 RepID=A0ABS1NRC8_9ACTN|nr:sigma-70 family RNA polymerase sigma factor [Streptomyces coffeae]MBL1102385.1 sigma-70 family RNA polymerase sigma factor [Streptomyces coffeae]
MRRTIKTTAVPRPAGQPVVNGGAADNAARPGRTAAPAPASPSASASADPVGQEREAAVARLFDQHYASMLRLAALLGADDPENIVAEAYYQIYRKWRKLRDAESAEAYLRSTVCNLTRMRIRHLQVVRRHSEVSPADPVASAENSALLRDDQQVLVNALEQLPTRQREALVLRHWLGLKESEIAAAMGISAGSVKTHTARGLAALTQAMEARR